MRLPPAEARRRFATAKVARLATVTPDGGPHLVPIVFALVDDQVSFAVDFKAKSTSDLQRLANIRHEPRVSFLVDAYDDDWSNLWWVRADGCAEVIEPAADERWHTAIELLVRRYPDYRERPPSGAAVVSRVTRWSGWGA